MKYNENMKFDKVVKLLDFLPAYIRSHDKLRKILFYGLLSGGLMALAGGALILWLVVISPGDAIRPENIEKILAMETPILYNDGQSKIGVFFQEAHRQYLTYEEIPQEFIDSLVAAEDHSFFEHHGIDPWAITRAMMKNIMAGRVVQGGSTLTQQTAKNLFKRKGRSIGAKLKELIYAWRLEYHYPKEKILEFYINQFFVSGNGRGLGVASRYYFDKPVSELTLLECAFIAGSVKRPNYYNPFIKKTEEEIDSAKEEARNRVAYVLGQLYKLGKIDAGQHLQHLEDEIPFSQGRMTYSLNTVMDLVKEALAEPEVEEALSEHGIDNMATSGIRIVTTIEKPIQENGLYALRKELSRLDVRLKGYDRETVQAEYPALAEKATRSLQVNGFLFGRIIGAEKDEEKTTEKNEEETVVRVALGTGDDESGPKGIIDEKGLMNVLSPLIKYKRQRWSEAKPKHLPQLLGQLKEGDLVYVSVRDRDPLTNEYLLDLEKYPEIQGAALAMKEGKVLAMVGGMENRYYNRAIAAKRPMGSVIKPLVYCAALQLGWNTLDLLNNERNIFVYQNSPYFPRPDHVSPHSQLSMTWAGVKSENVATVWLLYHLCDKLSPAQFKELVTKFGLDRQPEESDKQYQKRMRDKHGILVNRGTLSRVAFAKAVAEIEPDLLFEGKMNEYEVLRTFHYGDDFDKYLEMNDTEFDEYLDENDLTREAEAEMRRAVLGKNFLNYKKLRHELMQLKEETMAFVKGRPSATKLYSSASGRFIYVDQPPGEGWHNVRRQKLSLMLASRNPQEREKFWEDVRIEGLLSPETIKMLEELTRKEYKRLAALPEYAPEILHQMRDFRVFVALRYLTGLCRAIGIESRLDPVLSFPLGSNVINLVEVAKAYESLTTGRIVHHGGEEAGDGLSLIERIENSDGEIIYIPERTERQVVDAKIAVAVSDILKNVVQYGTGRRADREVRVHSLDPETEGQLQELNLGLVLLGKTGTANRFTNAAFAGVVPGVTEAGNRVSVANGCVLTAYVGFDDNKPMAWNTTHISGSGGALPIWTRMANAIVLHRDYAGKLDLVDFTFSGLSRVPLEYPELGQVRVPMDIRRGGIATTNDVSKSTLVTYGQIMVDGEFKPARFFRPYWHLEENLL